VVPENAWYILPAKEIEGMRSVSLMTPTSRYEGYREAWHLLHEAVGPGAASNAVEAERVDEAAAAEGSRAEEPASQFSPFSAFGRMEKAMKGVRDRLTRGTMLPPKSRNDG
jgi:hypothetical protein